MGSIQASLTRRGARERTFRGLKPTAKVSRRYRGGYADYAGTSKPVTVHLDFDDLDFTHER